MEDDVVPTTQTGEGLRDARIRRRRGLRRRGGMFWAIQPYTEQQVSPAEVPRHIWMPARNALRHRLVGLKAALPSLQLIIDAGTAFQAFDGCVRCRNEVEVELQRIAGAVDQLHTAFRVRRSQPAGGS